MRDGNFWDFLGNGGCKIEYSVDAAALVADVGQVLFVVCCGLKAK